MQDTVFSRSRLGQQIFPGGTTYEEYLAAQESSGAMDELKGSILPGVRSKFLEFGLSGEAYDKIDGPVNLDTYFGPSSPVFLQPGEYDAAKEAYVREQDGTASQQDLDLLTQVRDPDGPVMKRIARLSASDPTGVLQQGYLDTGGFPQNLMTGEIVLPDEITSMTLPGGFTFEDVPATLPIADFLDGPTDIFALNLNRKQAQERSEQALELQTFLSSNIDTPRDPVIRRALDQVINADVLGIVAERMYNLADISEEGIEHYLPRLSHWATNYNLTSENTFGILSAENFLTDEAIAEDLMQVRALSSFADRGKVLNDLLRKQVKDIVGEDTFNESIYAIVDEVTYETADGKTVTKEEYRHNFVSETFAEQFFEATLNSKSFLSRVAVFMLENVGAGYAIRVPFAVAGNAVRQTARLASDIPMLSRPAFGTAARYLSKDGKVLTKAQADELAEGEYMTLPYSAAFMDTPTLVKYTEQYAQFRGVPFSVAAKQLQRQTRAESMLVNGTISTLVGTGPMRGGRLAAVAEGGQQRAALLEAADTASDAIKAGKKKLNKAIDEGNNAAIIASSFDIRAARARQNWAVVRTATQGARDYGFSPGFDTAIALSQSFYRGISPETGPISDFYSAAVVMGALTIKRGFDIRGGIPLVSSVASTGMYNAKTFTEDSLAVVFGSLAALRTGSKEMSVDARDAIRLAGEARAQGIFTPPGLRDLLAASPEKVAKLPVATRRMLQTFSKGMWRSLAPDDREALLLDMTEGMEDVKNVMRPFYTLTDAAGNRIFDDPQIEELEANMALNLGQLTGMGFLLSIQRQQQAANAGTFMSGILKFSPKVADAFGMQRKSEKQVADMTRASEILDAQIMKLKAEDLSKLSESESIARSVALDNLELFAGQFRRAATEGRRSLDEMITTDARDAQRAIDNLTQPENAKFLDQAFVSGELDLLLGKIAGYQRMAARSAGAISGVAKAPGEQASDFVDIEGKKLRDRRKAMIVEDRLAQAVSMIQEASIKALDKGRPTQDAIDISKAQSKTLQHVVQAERAESEQIIIAAYDGISDEINIPIVSFGNSLDAMFRTYNEDKNASFLSFVNPDTLRALGGTTGVRLFNDLDKAAARSIDQWFDGKTETINSTFKRLGRKFEDGASFREFMKDSIVRSDPEAAKLLDVTSGSQISDLQLAYYMAKPNKLNVSAEDLRMVTSPMELETFRQAANKMIGSTDTAKQSLGLQLKREVDRAFENWANTTGSIDEYNQVVLARTVYRAEQLRFEGRLTFGGNVEAKQGNTQLTGETDTADLSFILDPFVTAITNPNNKTASIVQTEIQKIVNTIAPVSHSLLEQRLVQQIGTDGKYVQLDDKAIEALVERSVDMDTFMTMKGVLGNAVRNAFYGASDMSRISNALDNGLIPGLVPDDAPKRIRVPNEYQGNVQRYLADIEQMSMITVNTADGPRQMQLLDMSDLLMSDRQIDVVVNSIPEFRQAHADLLTIIGNAQEDIQSAQALVKEDAAALAKVEETLPQSFSGQGFISNVMGNDAPDQSRVFLQRLQTSKAFRAMSPEKQQEAMQSLFVDTIKTLGDYGPSQRSVRLFDGSTVVTGAYGNPAEVFSVLDDALHNGSKEGIALKRLADAANISAEQIETLHSLFRMSVRIQHSDMLARKADGKLTSITKGFTLDNALSKAFNLARGMVSKEYVMAEVAIRYAALAKGKSLDFLLNDKKSAQIVKQLLDDESLVADEDAYYFATQLSKFVADEVPRGLTAVNVTSNPYLEEYYINLGVLQPVDVGEIVFNQTP